VRTPLVAANWKMHKSAGDARRFASELLPRLRGVEGVEVAIAPPFTALPALAGSLGGSGIALAAQNVHPQPAGAFTGEISIPMLSELGCRYCIVGHSERRALFGETDAFVAEKVAALMGAGLRPILCIGETLEQRESGRTHETLRRQLSGSLARADADSAAELVIAYEPVWAIGTGRTATPDLAQEAHAFVRAWLRDRYGAAAGSQRILYGGSMKPDNAAALLAQPDIDGGLVGGASLDPADFSAIIRSRESVG
jgi:triosephosphate isomerase